VAITRRPANRHTVVATGWTNPQNAYALTGDNVYATLASARNATLSGDFGFPDITTSPALPGAWTSNPQGSNTFEDVAYGNGTWVAVGDTGTLRYTTDPTGTWTSNPQGTSTFRAVAYGNGTWVAVGDGGTLRYTTDPTGTWTSNPQGTSTFLGVAYGNGTWVAVGNSATFRYASDPTGTWTSNPQGSSDVYAVAYGNGTWVAVGDGGTLRYTTDPTGTWTSNPQGSSNFRGVAYGNGTWVAVGATGTLRYASEQPGIPDGSTINSVKVKVEWGMTASVTGGALGLQSRVNNANNGTETVKTTTTEEQAEASFSGVTLSDLRVAESSDRIEARIRVTKGSTTSAMTGRLDFCYLEVDFRWPLLL
jgi:hypothetical protein